jgi:hypothetical protein
MPPSSIETLRVQLREKFPQAHGFRAQVAEPQELANLFAVETFPPGAISEVVSAGPVSGVGLMMAGLLGDSDEGSRYPELVLIDGADAFDPGSFSAAACSRVLWVRCRAAMEMLKTADLLARDGNVPFLLLDATGLARKDLLAFPASSWWRLRQTVEGNGGRLVVISAFPMVPCAARRWQLAADLSLCDFDCPRAELRERLRVTGERRHRVS